MQSYPIYFTPLYKDYVWGGRKLVDLCGRSIPYTKAAESWEIADRKEGMSIVENGVYQGLSLHDLVRLYGKELMGEREEKFPLLIKLIDAKQSLSVQVHPGDAQKSPLIEPKTELWYVLEAAASGGVFAGFSQQMTPTTFVKAVEEKELLSYLQRKEVKKGDAVFIPGGMIHAILQGTFLLEIQENSDTTYRIYDWQRGRKLHIPEALSVLDWEINPPILCAQKKGKNCTKVHQSPHFSIEKWTTSQLWKGPFSRFSIIFLLEGKGSIQVDDVVEDLTPFRACLIPASASFFSIELQKGSYLRIW